ncbi:hypothetical protein KIH39_23960 [Telmatocola sphagniphila]|uniref:HEAT repeat domain-containing protein n=1 Tax=Telmatocola sphagniphila TaxID=1123043 RepID=A0A8E6EUU4_9BACT|nr:HEAT repeat domain-containing protein [Telmatocola sphagniphila]QVL31855.1 hypothetical protein KIH39_23960 [Telmatocola sphagniphila]
MLRASLLVVCFTMVPFASLECDEPKPNGERDKKARELVRQLGDPVFRKRDAAAQELVAMGTESLPALQAAVNDQDAEIRERSRQLLPLVLEADLKTKLIQFRKDKTGEKNIGLPCWKRFSRAVGSDKKSRDFFAEMVSNNMELFQYVETDARRAMEICDQLGPHYVNGVEVPHQRKPNLFDTVAFLLVSSEPNFKKIINLKCADTFSPVARLLAEREVQFFFDDQQNGSILKKVFLLWLDVVIEPFLAPRDTPAPSYIYDLEIAMYTIERNEIDEAVEFVEKVVSIKDPRHKFERAQAICFLSRFQNPKHLKLLETLRDDDSVLKSFNIWGPGYFPVSAEVRDVALGTIITLSGESPEQFGFDGINHPYFKQRIGKYYNPIHFGFETDEHRKAAFKKWDEFVAKKAKEGEKK